MARVMLDLETLGRDPGCAIISLGAVKFTTDGPTGDEFYRSISAESCEQHGLTIEAGTLQWWLDQDAEARKVLKGGDALEEVLFEFREWYAGRGAGSGPSGTELWACAPTFDCTILRAAYDATDQKEPWSHWNERCHRTVKEHPAAPNLKREGTHHNAVDDARHQAKVCAAFLKNTRRA